MKSERRHELQTNALADWLGEAIEKIRPYQNAIVGGLILVVVLIIALAAWHSYSAGYAAEAWGALKWPYPVASFQDLPDLDKVAKVYPGTPAADWAAVLNADGELTRGSQLLWVNKAQAEEQLKAAASHYQAAYNSNSSPLLRQRSLLGLAQTAEAQAAADRDATLRKLDEAREKYEELSKTWPDGVFKGIADQRLQDLTGEKAEPSKWFYEQFGRFDPKPMPPKDAGLKDFAPLPENPPAEPPKTPAKPQTPAKKDK